MKNFGPFLIMHRQEFPLFRKAYKLARTMTEIQLDDILERRYHLQRYPTRRLKAVASDKCQAFTEGEG